MKTPDRSITALFGHNFAASIDRWSEGLIYGGLAIAALILFTVDLGGVALRDWDESLVAQVAKEIHQAPFAAKVWLHPTLHGQPYFNKPPLVHWLVAIAYVMGGVNEWTARLPGALATAWSVPLLYGLCRELFPQRAIAIFTACTYLTLLPVVRHGRLAMLDGMVLLCFLGLLLSVVRSRR
ncbi:MAG: glycosyltransferase family 39 protein, partial [Leptolyngbyaceae bacterium]|nr:glycosyltransferase family 39 protein [Leptolyngbyaceae bacterium]